MAKLPVTAACPVFTAASTASPGAGAAGAVASAGGRVSLRLLPAHSAPGAEKRSSLTLTSDATGASLGAWTIDLTYDPTAVKIDACTPIGGSVCNPSYAVGIVRVSGASGDGLSGSQSLARIDFEGVRKHNAASALAISSATLTNVAGNPLAVR